MSRLQSTIVAVSSPPGRSARGLVRLSGPEAFSILGRMVEPSDFPAPRSLTVSRLHDPALPSLPVLVTCFPSPNSYTGEDIAEVQLPGHPALLERFIRRAVEFGATLAEPGEFTFRAYLAGRLDLTEAEGIAATISAVSDAQLAAAGHLREGELGRFAAAHVEEVGRLLALVEAGIDFTDQEDVVPIAPRDLAAALDQVIEEVRRLLTRSRSWGSIEALPRVVLVGPPSAGKSTLFNALLGRERAVVDALPGTTRDVLEEVLRLEVADVNPRADAVTDAARGLTSAASGSLPGSLPGGEVMLVDLAGLDEATGILDRQVQAAADHAIARADLVLLLGDTGRALPVGVPVIRIATKSDLTDDTIASTPKNIDLHVSALTGHHLPELRRLIAQRLGDRAISITAETLALQPRHEAALRSALTALSEARATIDPHALSLTLPELVAAPLRDALDHLAHLGGHLTPDNVIGKVFATFCVGK